MKKQLLYLVGALASVSLLWIGGTVIAKNGASATDTHPSGLGSGTDTGSSSGSKADTSPSTDKGTSTTGTTGTTGSGMGTGTGSTTTTPGTAPSKTSRPSGSGMGAGTESGAPATGEHAKGYEIQAKDIISISFTTNSSKLSKSEIQSAKSFVDLEKTGGAKVDSYIVAAWSDQDYAGVKQASAEQKLAKNRAKAVEKALKDAGASSVSTYEMTEEPTWIGKAFSTSDAEIKGAGGTSTTNEKVMADIGQSLRAKGGPGKVVVVAKHKTP